MSAVSASPVISVRDVRVAFPGTAGPVMAANRVSFAVRRGETLGVVGESGCGKSVTLRALCGLVPPPGRLLGGEVEIDGAICRRPEDFAAVRGSKVSMIFQDPAASLNPVMRIGDQLTEVLRVKAGLARAVARRRAVELLDHVGIPAPRARFAAYPHELSGGMRQRVMIAIAIAPRPAVLLADEPTTALDVTTQEQILDLLLALQQETGMAIVLVTHDLGVVTETCDAFVTMYGGYVVERGEIATLTQRPCHPYTRALLAAMPRIHAASLPDPIPGQPPDLAALPDGCPFIPRCTYARPACSTLDMHADALAVCACPFSHRDAA